MSGPRLGATILFTFLAGFAAGAYVFRAERVPLLLHGPVDPSRQLTRDEDGALPGGESNPGPTTELRPAGDRARFHAELNARAVADFRSFVGAGNYASAARILEELLKDNRPPATNDIIEAMMEPPGDFAVWVVEHGRNFPESVVFSAAFYGGFSQDVRVRLLSSETDGSVATYLASPMELSAAGLDALEGAIERVSRNRDQLVYRLSRGSAEAVVPRLRKLCQHPDSDVRDTARLWLIAKDSPPKGLMIREIEFDDQRLTDPRLEAGDIILELSGEAVPRTEEFWKYEVGKKQDQTARVRVWRDGQAFDSVANREALKRLYLLPVPE